MTPANPFAGRHYGGRIDIAYRAPERGLAPSVEIQTDRLTLRPTTDDPRTVEFYQRALYGDAQVMRRFADGRPRTAAESEARVRQLAGRWRAGDHGSALLISWTKTGELLGHAVLGHGDHPGESEYALLLASHGDDGTPLWNRGVGKEVTYAIYTGWAPFLAERGVAMTSDSDGRAYPLELVTATVRHDSSMHGVLARLLHDDPTNREREREEVRFGAPRTHFYTTPQAMRSLRRTLVAER